MASEAIKRDTLAEMTDTAKLNRSSFLWLKSQALRPCGVRLRWVIAGTLWVPDPVIEREYLAKDDAVIRAS